MEEPSQNTCDVCKISYATEGEFKDHVWSLMHHIKIEQKKKGVVHNCSLCYTSCENLIEYGKHLNEDKHKRCLAEVRRAKENSSSSFDQLSQADRFARDKLDETAMEVEFDSRKFRKPHPKNAPKNGGGLKFGQMKDGMNGSFHPRHQRSFSQPELQIARDTDGRSVKKKKKYKTYGDKSSNGNQRDNDSYHMNGSDNRPDELYNFRSDHQFSRNDNYMHYQQQPFKAYGQHYQQYPQNQHRWRAPVKQFQNNNHLYTPFDSNSGFQNKFSLQQWQRRGHPEGPRSRSQSCDRLYSEQRVPQFAGYGSLDNDKDNFDRRRDQDNERHYNDGGYLFNRNQPDDERGRQRTKSPTAHVEDVSPCRSTDSSSSENSSGLKRRRDMEDVGSLSGKSRKSNESNRIQQESSKQRKDIVAEVTPEPPRDASDFGRFEADIQPISLSSENLEESFKDKVPMRREARKVITPPLNTNERHLKHVTWADDSIPCRDIENDKTLENESSKLRDNFAHRARSKNVGFLPTPRSNVGLLPIPRSNSLETFRRPIDYRGRDLSDGQRDKQKDVTSTITSRNKTYSQESPVNLASSSSTRDHGESVLEKAEKLCRKLRDEREKGKKEKELKERHRKLEKQMELTTQIQILSEKNKENIRGHLQNVEGVLESALNQAESPLQASQLGEPSTSSLNRLQSASGRESPSRLSSSTSSIGSKQSHSQNKKMQDMQSEIEKIRKNIESSVNKEQVHEPRTLLSPQPKFTSPLPRARLQKKKSNGMDKDSLLQMINSPRNRKEQIHLAEMLRNYAQRKSKLSLPRFNLQQSDLVEKPVELESELVNLSPDVQLEIAKFMEADVKPDIAELERMLEERCTGEIHLDFGDMIDIPVQRDTNTSPTIIPAARANLDDVAPSLSIDELTSEVRQAADFLLRPQSPSRDITSQRTGPRTVDTDRPSRQQNQSVQQSKSSNQQQPGQQHLSLDIHQRQRAASPLTQSTRSVRPNSPPVIKPEVLDDKELSLLMRTDKQNMDVPLRVLPGSSPTRSIHSPVSVPRVTSGIPERPETASGTVKDLTNPPASEKPWEDRQRHSSGPFVSEEAPVRDTPVFSQADSSSTSKKSTLEQVNAILDATPNMEDVLRRESSSPQPQPPQPPTEAVSMATTTLFAPQLGNDVMNFGSSQTSVGSGQSVLDAVYDISLKEENIRQELTSVDTKISKLQKLMEEASEQLKKFSQQKEVLKKEEGDMRSKRFRLLQDSRSQQGSSSSQTGRESPSLVVPPQFSHLTESQLQNLNNPVFMKFMMSQKHSDMSSVGGYSMVESGSQAEADRDSEPGHKRRGSITSDISTVSHDQPEKPQQTPSAAPPEERCYLTQSVDLLSGSAESVCSGHSGNKQPNKEADGLSLLAPLEKTGFITLDSLMNDTSDLGKLLQKSLEEASKSPCTPERVRRNSVLSIGSDDILQSGSDVEKRSGKFSMKFMGTLPDGVDSDMLLRQLSGNSISAKGISCTVVSSPEAISQLKKLSDSGLGTSTPQYTNTIESDCKSEVSSHTASTLNDIEVHSARSGYSLGEEISKRCAGQNPDATDSEGTKTLEEDPLEVIEILSSPSRNLRSRKNKETNDNDEKKTQQNEQIKNTARMPSPSTVATAARKKLKSKKERDKSSRRKQKEDFIIETSSDGASFEEEVSVAPKQKHSPQQAEHMNEEDLVETGSEDPGEQASGDVQGDQRKASLLEMVELESPSDSTEDRDGVRARSRNTESVKAGKPVLVLEKHHMSGKTKPQVPQKTIHSVQTVKFHGPEVAVASMQIFKGELYVCYNGSEVRRFNLKTGEVLKELDCSPYLVQCLLITSIEEREDILFMGGACKKLMLFKPQKFSIIQTYDYDERIMGLHENWGRLFVGLSDGVISVRSLKTDKELNTFQCTDKSIVCMTSTSAGMTKLLCCGTSDKLIYILDATSGLLITMLEGHSLTPLCLQVYGEMIVSGSADKMLLLHNVSTGTLEKRISDHKAMISDIYCDTDTVYTICYDKFVRCYNKNDFRCKKVYYGAGRNMLTSVLVNEGKILTGDREGLVEAVPVTPAGQYYTCQCEDCDLHFGIEEHLLHHMMTDHILPNSRMVHCPLKGCSEWLSTHIGNNNAEEHLISKHFN